MVCMKMGDRDILKYSMMGLPNLTPQMRDARKDWVKKNVDLAEKHLQKLEELNKESYGETDESHRNYAEEMPSCQEDSTEGGSASAYSGSVRRIAEASGSRPSKLSCHCAPHETAGRIEAKEEPAAGSSGTACVSEKGN